MKTKRHYKKHNKLTKANKANKANKTNKKIGGNGDKEKMPEILKEPDYRTFEGVKYNINNPDEYRAFEKAVKGDDDQPNSEEKKPENKNNEKQAPKKKWGYKKKAAVMFFTGLIIGISLLVIKPDKIN
jgi:hypothetical protein